MNVTVVCEDNASMHSPEGIEAYPEGMGVCLKQLLEEDGNAVTLVRADENGVEGLTDDILAATDVMFWWGHWYHGAVSDELIAKVAERALRGMGMVFLHSAHDSKMFKKLLGTSCSLKWREDGELERLWCVDMSHPIARGLGEFIDIPREEMYGEPFDIPVPDELVYIGWFRGPHRRARMPQLERRIFTPPLKAANLSILRPCLCSIGRVGADRTTTPGVVRLFLPK